MKRPFPCSVTLSVVFCVNLQFSSFRTVVVDLSVSEYFSSRFALCFTSFCSCPGQSLVQMVVSRLPKACHLPPSVPHCSEALLREEESVDTTSGDARFLHACDIAISDFEISHDFRYRISDFSFFISSSSSMMRYRFSKIENLIFENLLIEGR